MPKRAEELNCLQAKTQIDQLLSSPIIPESMDLSSILLNTPFDYHCDKYPSNEFERLRPQDSGVSGEFCRLLEDVFSHTTANPSIPGNRERMRVLYTFPDTKRDGTSQQDRYVNRDRPAIKAFLKEMIELAKENSQMHLLSKADSSAVPDLSTGRLRLANKSRVILVGHKGIGKTMLLNYILDEFIDLMDESKVIWVRLDLTKPHIGIGLVNWLHWQTLRIIFRHYDGKKLCIDLSHNNQTFAERLESTVTNTIGTKQAFQIYNDTKLAISVDGSPDREDSVQPQRVQAWIYKAVFEHLVEDLGISFVFVIDGLDKLGLTSLDQREYDTKMDQVNSAILQEKANSGVYLITMRWDSYFELRSSAYRGYEAREVEGAPTLRIFENKARCLEKRHLFPARQCAKLNRLPEAIYLNWARETVDGFLRFVSHCLSLSLEGVRSEDRAKGVDILDRAFGPDKRNIFRCLSTVVRHLNDQLPTGHLDKQLEELAGKETLEETDFTELPNVTVLWSNSRPSLYSKHYLFIEAVMLQGWAFCKSSYRHLWGGTKHPQSDEDWIRLSLHRGKQEQDLFPNVLNYPYRGTRRGGFPFLVQIRILQTIEYQKWGGIDDTADLLNTYFGYPKALTRMQMEEMRDLGLLRRHRRPSYESQDEMVLTEMGEFALSNLLHNLEYVGLALETAPLPNDLVESGLFPISSYNDHVEFVVCNKIVSAINTVRIIKHMEGIEKASLERAFGSDSGRFAAWSKVYHEFRLGERIGDRIKAPLHRLVEDAYKNKESQPGLFKRLEETIREFPNAKP